jgi:hypothetical protein
MGVLLKKTPHNMIKLPCCKENKLISVAPHFEKIFGFSKNNSILSVSYKITPHFGVEEKFKVSPRTASEVSPNP